MKAGIKFMVDTNVGKLARWLRMIGYDAVYFKEGDDAEMISDALREERVVITRDSQIVKRWVVTSGRLRVILASSDQPERQIQQVVSGLDLGGHFKPFTICLECNRPLENVPREAVKDRVPSYVYRTQPNFLECPACRRVYWRGSHWAAMCRRLDRLFPVDRRY